LRSITPIHSLVQVLHEAPKKLGLEAAASLAECSRGHGRRSAERNPLVNCVGPELVKKVAVASAITLRHHPKKEGDQNRWSQRPALGELPFALFELTPAGAGEERINLVKNIPKPSAFGIIFQRPACRSFNQPSQKLINAPRQELTNYQGVILPNTKQYSKTSFAQNEPKSGPPDAGTWVHAIALRPLFPARHSTLCSGRP
jgi:hypothetical protein